MRTLRIDLRHWALIALALAATPALAATEATGGTPALVNVSMETNYIMLLLAVLQVVIIITLGSVIRSMGGSGSLLVKHLTKARTVVPIALLLLTIGEASAATEAASTVSANTIFWFLAAGNMLLFVMLLSQLMILRAMVRAMVPEPEQPVAAEEGPSWADTILQRLTRTKKVEEEQDILMHHEYDGIRELDNVLPPWWLWLFYATVIWGVVYVVNVHVIEVWPHQEEEYRREMAEAKASVEAYLAQAAASVDENTATVNLDAAMVAQGKAIYDQNCKACHGAAGEGTVGPNLTDDHWKNGGGIKNIFRTVKYGVPERGMIAWKAQLNPTEIHAVSNYIISLHGTNPANPKEPEGELWMEEAVGVVKPEAAAAGI
jgi:cytochrome c oxidase cbb3-type subunit III